jgi:predicted metal-dependent HD superfamily phosphohydrolase
MPMHAPYLAGLRRHFNLLAGQLAGRRMTLLRALPPSYAMPLPVHSWSEVPARAGLRPIGEQHKAHHMDALDLVQRCWNDLVLRRGWDPPSAGAVLEETVRAYGESHRHYHTLGHIAALLALLDHYGADVADRDALTLAILFHDVVYDPNRQDNEEASAAWAAARLTGLGPSEELGAKVARYILATRHDRPLDATGEPDLALLLDLDLSILAAPPGDYGAYAEAVRREYAFVPDRLYRAGRRRILEGFLQRQRLYLTEPLRTAWEQLARANLNAEIAQLTCAAHDP